MNIFVTLLASKCLNANVVESTTQHYARLLCLYCLIATILQVCVRKLGCMHFLTQLLIVILGLNGCPYVCIQLCCPVFWSCGMLCRRNRPAWLVLPVLNHSPVYSVLINLYRGDVLRCMPC